MHPNDGRVVSNFIMQALKNEPITIYGDGSQTRSFCYVDDMIDGFIKMMNSPDEFVGPVNLGNTREISILEIANMITDITNSNSKVIFNSLPKDDPVRRKPDISLAEKELNWQPKVPLEDGLKKTIDYFSDLLSNR